MGQGIGAASGIAGGYQALNDLLKQRILMQKFADEQQQQHVENALRSRTLDQEGARRQQELQLHQQQLGAQNARAQVDDTRLAMEQTPLNSPLAPADVPAIQRAGLGGSIRTQTPNLASANLGMGALRLPPDVQQVTGQQYAQEAPALPARPSWGGTAGQQQQVETNRRADEAQQRLVQAASAAAAQHQAASQLAQDTFGLHQGQAAETVRHNKVMESKPSASDSGLVKIERTDPATGRTVVDYLPKSEVRGKSFSKPASSIVQNRIASAVAVTQTGEDIINKLSDPKYQAVVGPALGRSATLRDFIGNPPPEFSELAGQIESYALANMGVHGMRSAQGAEQIKSLLDKKHTPASLAATIRGINAFSQHFMENEGRQPQEIATPAPTGGNKGTYKVTKLP